MTTQAPPPTNQQTTQDQTPASSQGITVTKAGFTLLSALPGFIAGLAGAGWPGVIAMLLGGFGLVFGIDLGIKKLNKMIDGRDSDNAGADAGNTAVDLANQGAGNRQDIAALEQSDPPTKPQ